MLSPVRAPYLTTFQQHLTARMAWLTLAAVACAYLLPGIFGHGPWKQDEAYSFGMIHHMLTSGEYLVPTNAGVPFMEKPPLYYWTALLFAKALHPWLSYADGARATSVFFMLVALLFIARIARAAWNEDGFLNARVLGTLALFAGTVGMVKHAHDMFTDVALVCGGSIAMYGLLQIAQNEQNKTPKLAAAIWFGLGVGIAEMSKGLFVPIIYAATALCVAAMVPACRSRSYLYMIGAAILVSLPFFVIWPLLLAQHSLPLFMEWFWDNNVGRFFGFSVKKLGSGNDHAVIFRALSGFALPGAPLAAFAIVTGDWRKMNRPRIAVPLSFTLICVVLLLVSATARQLYLLPLILPLCMLGSRAIDRLPDSLHAGWDWLARLFFGAATAFIWMAYAISTGPVEQHDLLSPLAKWLPIDYVSPLQPLALTTAALLTLSWLLCLPRLKQFGKWRGAGSWFAGITMTWGVAYTLLLPWADHAKSYEFVYERLSAELLPAWREGDCMASIGLGESEAPTLYYYTGILHQPVNAAQNTDCRWVIVQSPFGTGLPAGGWKPFWTGSRDGDDKQTFTVYERSAPAAAGSAANGDS
ncbi:glycosyltransferase family 39 protein [Herbaspirillum sp. RV1423]|uniref:ArnT family glycosyltransferase n=1 Tax=Herbaspirillum sp. RV1423 TaxID=1443993 RepID=UPI0005591EA5|nr:glycosyl transferase [Herbaspirillum sp. RV1423]